MKYREFSIALTKPTDDAVEVILDDNQPVHVSVDWRRVDAYVDFFRRPLHLRQNLTTQDLEILGKLLADILFPADIARTLERAVRALDKSAVIRIYLLIDDSELAQIPWEYAHLHGEFLALNRDYSIVRSKAGVKPGVFQTYPIHEEVAEAFKQTLLEGRKVGQTVEATLTAARWAIARLRHPLNVEWGLPALYLPAIELPVMDLPADRSGPDEGGADRSSKVDSKKPPGKAKKPEDRKAPPPSPWDDVEDDDVEYKSASELDSTEDDWLEEFQSVGAVDDAEFEPQSGSETGAGFEEEEEALEDEADFEEEAASAPERESLPRSSTSDEAWDVVPVFYGTNRKWQGGDEPEEVYSADRSEKIEYGQVTITIPKRRHVGEFNRPAWWKLEFRANPKKHIILESVTKMAFSEWEHAVIERKTDANEAFLFVHGFKVTFAKAAMRTAQLALDLNGRNPGLTFMFSWPSKGELGDYKADESTSIWAAADLQIFIEKLLLDLEIRKINIVAHSMGNRLLLDALQNLDTSNIPGCHLEIIMAAPDVDAFHFKRVVGKLLKDGVGHYSLYASSEDRALKQSQRIHDVARAGQGGEHLIVLDGMDSIDVSEIDTSLLGHSYYGDIQQVIMDMYHLIFNGLRANRRGLGEHKKEGLTFWRFRA